MSPNTRNWILFLLNIIVWGLVGLSYKGTLKLTAKFGIGVTLETEPSRIKLTLDGKIWDGSGASNGWIQTPALIHVSAGQHKVLLERPGYSPHSFKILVNDGDRPQLKTTMENLQNNMTAVEVDGDADELDNVIASIDGGLEEGSIPLKAEDLMPGIHSLELRVTGIESFRSKPFSCTFVTKQTQFESMIKLTVSKTGKKFKVSNCKRVMAH